MVHRGEREEAVEHEEAADALDRSAGAAGERVAHGDAEEDCVAHDLREVHGLVCEDAVALLRGAAAGRVPGDAHAVEARRTAVAAIAVCAAGGGWRAERVYPGRTGPEDGRAREQ